MSDLKLGLALMKIIAGAKPSGILGHPTHLFTYYVTCLDVGGESYVRRHTLYNT